MSCVWIGSQAAQRVDEQAAAVVGRDDEAAIAAGRETVAVARRHREAALGVEDELGYAAEYRHAPAVAAVHRFRHVAVSAARHRPPSALGEVSTHERCERGRRHRVSRHVRPLQPTFYHFGELYVAAQRRSVNVFFDWRNNDLREKMQQMTNR